MVGYKPNLLEKLGGDKRSSLFGPFVSYELNRFITLAQVYWQLAALDKFLLPSLDCIT